MSYFDIKYALESGSPQPGSAFENSIAILIDPMTNPLISPQNAPGSVVLSQNTASVKTTAIGGHKKLETELM